ncbi:hypothetical protein BDA96_04G170900 [Sorghum bicolor]|uniref:Uncharacterized protein n=1 Tax=Sorghum bicolor TaxID=4558 RepID=A0A921UJ96_SORBI|nr:hypothetical protein BDA96_04G170900 [Sorghum bicolor]
MSGILPTLAPREPAPQVDAATAGTRGHGIAQRGRAWVPRHRSQGAQWGRSACRVGWRGRKGKGCRGGGGEHRGERWRRRASQAHTDVRVHNCCWPKEITHHSRGGPAAPAVLN